MTVVGYSNNDPNFNMLLNEIKFLATYLWVFNAVTIVIVVYYYWKIQLDEIFNVIIYGDFMHVECAE